MRRARRQSILYSLMLAGCAGILLPAPSRPPDRTIFSDEFSGRDLDRSRWNVIVTGETVNDEQQASVDSPETIAIVHDAAGAEGGALAIRTRYRPRFATPEGRKFDFNPKFLIVNQAIGGSYPQAVNGVSGRLTKECPRRPST